MIDKGKQVVIYERGKQIEKRIPPELLQFILLDDMAISLREIERSHKKEEFKGKVDTRTLSATDEPACLNLLSTWHYNPLITAYLVNDGPDTAYVAINEPYAWLEIKINETRTVDHTKADERIKRIYYKCASGATASVRIEGEY